MRSRQRSRRSRAAWRSPTTIKDPRGDDGSPEAQQAIAVCEAAVELLEGDGAEDAYMAVFEDDGTHFVLYGHARVPEDECTVI